jgi:hypothetical protein
MRLNSEAQCMEPRAPLPLLLFYLCWPLSVPCRLPSLEGLTFFLRCNGGGPPGQIEMRVGGGKRVGQAPHHGR